MLHGRYHSIYPGSWHEQGPNDSEFVREAREDDAEDLEETMDNRQLLPFLLLRYQSPNEFKH